MRNIMNMKKKIKIFIKVKMKKEIIIVYMNSKIIYLMKLMMMIIIMMDFYVKIVNIILIKIIKVMI
jgi:hypothetical protein